MKKLTLFCGLLIALSAFTITAKAQSAYFVSQTNGTTLDTVTNAGVRLQKLPIAGYQANVGIQVVVANLTGTIAGFVRVYGSDDGINFVRIPTQKDDGSVAIDSMKVDVNTLSKIFRIPPTGHYYTYYRTGFTGSGTQTTTFKTYAIWRKP